MQIFCRTAENRCSEDLPYSHALIRVPTIVQREFKLAQRHGNQPESSSTRVQDTSVVKTFSVNSLIDNERALEKPSNPRRRARNDCPRRRLAREVAIRATLLRRPPAGDLLRRCPLRVLLRHQRFDALGEQRMHIR